MSAQEINEMLCELCNVNKAPKTWYEQLEKLKREVASKGGEIQNIRYICNTCWQEYSRRLIGAQFMVQSGVN